MAASYPSAVKTFTTKSTNDTVQASHVTDLQDEVTAIEDGILNGTAPLSCSNATANALTVSSNVTLSGQPRCNVYHSGTQNIADNTWASVSLDSDQIDVGGLHSTASNPTRVTIPAGASGTYSLVGTVSFAANSSGERGIRFLKNSTTQLGGGVRISGLLGATPYVGQIAGLEVLDAADYVELQGFQNTGAALAVGDATNASMRVRFVAARLY